MYFSVSLAYMAALKESGVREMMVVVIIDVITFVLNYFFIVSYLSRDNTLIEITTIYGRD